MRSQVWSRVEEKRGIVLALRGEDLHRLEVTGKTARRDVPRILEALEEGQEPATVGARSIESLTLSSIGQVRVSPDQDDVEFRAGGDGGAILKFSTSGNLAGEIARAVLAGTGRTFREGREEITATEAVVPPAIVGVIVGALWTLLYMTAGQIAAGKAIEIHGRRAGLKRLCVMAAETLGVNGTLVLGAVLLLSIVAWATMRFLRRPHRTVWLAE